MPEFKTENSASQKIVHTYIPTSGTSTEQFPLIARRTLTHVALDYMASSLQMYRTDVQVPIIISKSRVNHEIVEMVRTSLGTFNFANWRKIIEMDLKSFTAQSSWLPSAAEIESLSDEVDSKTANAISMLYSEAMGKYSQSTLIKKFIRSNWVYHLGQYLKISDRLPLVTNYATVRELAMMFSELFVAANQAVTPKMQIDTLGRVASMLEEDSTELSDDARIMLSALVAMSVPMNMSTSRLTSVPLASALDMLSDLNLCAKPQISVSTEKDMGDSLIREVRLTSLIPQEVLEAINNIHPVDVKEFLLENISSRSFGVSFSNIGQFRTSVSSTISDVAKGNPTIPVALFSVPRNMSNTDNITTLVDNMVMHEWQRRLIGFVYNGILAPANPLNLKFEVSDDDAKTRAPQLVHITSALWTAYELFTHINSSLRDMFDYEALNRTWTPYYNAIKTVVDEKFSMIVKEDQKIAMFVYSSLEKQIPNDYQSFFKKEASLDIPETYFMNEVNVPDIKKIGTQPVIIMQGQGGFYYRQIVVREGISANKLMGVLPSLVLDGDQQGEAWLLSQLGIFHTIKVDNTRKFQMNITLPTFAKKLHNLVVVTVSVYKELKQQYARYGIDPEIMEFPTVISLLEWLDFEVTEDDLKLMGYDPKYYVTGNKLNRSKFVLYINTDPVLIERYTIPKIRMDLDVPGLTRLDEKDYIFVGNNTIRFDIAKMTTAADKFVIMSQQLIAIHQSLFAKVQTHIKNDEIETSIIDPLIKKIEVDATAPVKRDGVTPDKSLENKLKTESEEPPAKVDIKKDAEDEDEEEKK